LDAAGAPLGDPSLVSSKTLGTPLATAADPAGNLVVVGGTFQVMGALFDHDLVQASDLFLLGSSYPPESEPVLAARYSGGFVAMWTSGTTSTFPYPGVPATASTDGDSLGIAGQRFGAIRCAPGSGLLCFGPNGRFEARVAWKNPVNGESGTGQPVSLTPDTGAFWFFSEQNLELMVKVVDGTGFNGHFWIYTGSLSNVEYTLTVTDSVAGTERVYHNPPFQFGNVGDVNAFAATPDFFPVLTPFVLQPVPAPGCPPVYPVQNLCFGDEQFDITVTFKNPATGLDGNGTFVPLTQDTGVFWFFDDANLELMVKILDGRTVNGRFWFFYGALSDVDYTISVHNTKTNAVKTYHNRKGTLASGADIQAF
jgi:hypothetical protein